MIFTKQEIRKKFLKISLLVILLAITIAVVALLILKYHVEGETNLPFSLKNITIISSADGIHKKDDKNKWNIDVIQVNDIYMDFEKNYNLKDEEIIKNIKIENIKFTKSEIGEYKTYKLVKDENGINEYKDEYQVENLNYAGAEKTDLLNLTIGNQGGTIGVRFILSNLGEYKSNEETIKYDGTLLEKMKITEEQIQGKVSFDIIIELESGVIYKAEISTELPAGDIIENGIIIIEDEKLEEVIFKRV